MKQQVRATYRKSEYRNSTMPLLQLYLEKKMLSELGYRFDPDDLTDWEVHAFLTIENEIAKCQKQKGS